MNDLDKAWIALGKAIRDGATEKQVNLISARLDRIRGRKA